MKNKREYIKYVISTYKNKKYLNHGGRIMFQVIL